MTSPFLALSYEDQFQNNHITKLLKENSIQLYTTQVSAESMNLVGGLMILPY